MKFENKEMAKELKGLKFLNEQLQRAISKALPAEQSTEPKATEQSIESTAPKKSPGSITLEKSTESTANAQPPESTKPIMESSKINKRKDGVSGAFHIKIIVFIFLYCT